MPRHKIKFVRVPACPDGTHPDIGLLVPVEATVADCLEWVQTEGQTDLRVLAGIYFEDAAKTIVDMWNAAVAIDTLDIVEPQGSA